VTKLEASSPKDFSVCPSYLVTITSNKRESMRFVAKFAKNVENSVYGTFNPLDNEWRVHGKVEQIPGFVLQKVRGLF
jgi:hypothetical protein